VCCDVKYMSTVSVMHVSGDVIVSGGPNQFRSESKGKST